MDTVEQSDVEVQELIRSDQMYVEKTHAIYADTSIAQAHSELVARESRGSDFMKWAIDLHSTKKVQDHIGSGEAIHRRNVTSPPFKFVVGRKRETKEVYYLQSKLVASQSYPLDFAMNWSKHTGRDYVDIDRHDGRTFTAFTRYLYTGDYDIAPEISSLGSDAARQHVCWRPKNPHWERLLQSKEYGFQIPPCTGCNNEAPLSEMATCNSCRGRESAWQMLVSPAPVLNPGSLDTNFTEVFISHAKIFLFAVHYEVAELTNLSLRKLHQALCGFRLSKERVGDIMSLVRFCFDQNPDDDSRLKKLVADDSRLKKLVASYSAAIMDVETPAEVLEDFRELFQEVVEFGVYVARFLSCRITDCTEFRVLR